MEYSFQVLPLGLSINKFDTKKTQKKNCFNVKCYLLVVMISLRSLKTNTTGRKEMKFYIDTI